MINTLDTLLVAKALHPLPGRPQAFQLLQDGKVGFVRNITHPVVQEMLRTQPAQTKTYFVIQLEKDTIDHYEEYKYWVGSIVGSMLPPTPTT